jgi:hypothetical protein
MKKHKKKQGQLIDNPKQAARALEVLLATNYIDKKRLYLENFLRGMAFSIGGVVGATIVIALLLWLLSFFEEIPLIGPLFDSTRETINQN